MILSWRDRRWWPALAIMAVSYVFADSTLAVIGLFVTFFFLIRRLSLTSVVVAGCCVVGLGYGAYIASDNIKMRVDQTMRAQITSEMVEEQRNKIAKKDDPDATLTLGQTNASTLAWMSNGYAAYRAFTDYPLAGTGVGTHQFSYDRYVPEVLPKQTPAYGLNKLDACSLFLRIVSEMGVFGLVLLAFFLVRFFAVKDSRHAIIPLFIVLLVRHGNYFSFPLDFFSFVYVFNYLESRTAERHFARATS
jgi:O-antigen ligase